MPVYLRVWYDYNFFTKTTGIQVHLTDWAKKGIRVKGVTTEVNTTNTDKISQAICAFSNDMPGRGEPGYLIIGATDDGALCGLNVTDDLMLNAKTFDTLPCIGTSLDDLDTDTFVKYYLPKAIPDDILAEDFRSVKKQLISLGFFDYRFDCPTHAGIVLFGKMPERYLHGAYTQYVRFKGMDMAGDILKEYKFSGNLCAILTKLDHFIDTSIVARHPVPVSPLREETVYNYPYWATRELLMNAIMHRDYETNAPTRFYEFDNRIEIQNPGNLYGKARPENFPDVNDYRNPVIAEAMKVLGLLTGSAEELPVCKKN